MQELLDRYSVEVEALRAQLKDAQEESAAQRQEVQAQVRSSCCSLPSRACTTSRFLLHHAQVAAPMNVLLKSWPSQGWMGRS